MSARREAGIPPGAEIMDAASFFGLERGPDRTWRLPVARELCSGLGALFGGVGLGAAVEALEQEFGRPVVWATAQFLSFARPPSTVEIQVTEIVRGHRSSQVRATGTVEGEEIFSVVGAAGTRALEVEGAWAVAPRVPPVEDCPTRPILEQHRGTLAERLEIRLANARSADELPGPPGDGRSALWVRVPEIEISAATLSIVGDYVPFGISQALGRRAGGNSLDNTVRIVHRHSTEWMLADIRVHAVADGFGHGLVHLWSEDSTLLATASQSTIVRPWRDEPTSEEKTP